MVVVVVMVVVVMVVVVMVVVVRERTSNFHAASSSTVLEMHDVTVVTAHVSMQLDGRLRSEEGGMRVLVRERTLRAQLFRFSKSSRHLPMPRNEIGIREGGGKRCGFNDVVGKIQSNR